MTDVNHVGFAWCPVSDSAGHRHGDTLASQEVALDRQPLLAATPSITAVASQRPVRGDDPVAGDEQADRVAPHGSADSACGPGRTDPSGDLAVARRLAPTETRNRQEHISIPARTVREIERRKDLRRPTIEEGLESEGGDRQVTDARVVWTGLGGGLDSLAEAPAQRCVKAVT